MNFLVYPVLAFFKLYFFFFFKKEHTLVFLFGNEIIDDFGRVIFYALGILSCYISSCQKNIKLFRNIVIRKYPFYVCVYVCINNGCNI